MKKILVSGILSMGLMAPVVANADTLLGLYAGAQGWNMGTEGSFANTSNTTSFNFDDKSQSSFYVALEHPIPLVPNVKIRQSQMETMGDVNLTSSFSFGGELYSANSSLTTDLDLTNRDYILYYELFDNDLVSFDFGLNGKDIDGKILVQEAGNSNNQAVESFSGIVPMLYTRVAVGMPLTGWGAYAEGSFLSFDDHTLYDYQLAVTYSLLENIAVDLTFQLGYRAMMLELDDLDGVYTDLDFNGPFAGLEIHF